MLAFYPIVVTGMRFHVCGDQRGCVAGRHPVLAHGLDGRWNFGVGVAQKVAGLSRGQMNA